MSKRKLKEGTRVEFSFAGSQLQGVIASFEIDESYSTKTKWYKVKHQDGTIYPIRMENVRVVE